MKVALAYWENRISPVLDTSENFLVVDIQDGRRIKNSNINLGDRSLLDRIEYLKKHDVNVLLCGAISDYCHNLILARGIKVIPWLAGDVDGILEVYIRSNSFEPRFLMPGCKGHGRKRRRRKRGF